MILVNLWRYNTKHGDIIFPWSVGRFPKPRTSFNQQNFRSSFPKIDKCKNRKYIV